jgi:hypothetical protein
MNSLQSIPEENVIIEDNTSLTDGNQISNPPITVVFCIPGDNFSSEFLKKWTELFGFCLMNNIQPILSNGYSSNVFFVRNMCLNGDVLKGIEQKPFQGKINYDYIMWIDSDQVFSVQHFVSLLNANQDIVSGYYMMKNCRQYAVVPNMDNDYFLKYGSYQFLDDTMVKECIEKNNSHLLEVDYCGMGFMLVKKGVFEKFEYPWFQPETSEFTLGNVKIKDYNSEDVYFCKKCRELGYKIIIDLNVRVGHEKKLII